MLPLHRNIHGPALVAVPGINGFCHLFEVGGFFAGAVFPGVSPTQPPTTVWQPFGLMEHAEKARQERKFVAGFR